MNNQKFLQNYFKDYQKSLLETDVTEQIIEMKTMVEQVRKKNKKMIIAGNGASAAIASHIAVDFTKQASVRGINFGDAGLITCFGNDYGYENWVHKAIEFYADPGDLVVLVSSSGKSPNIVNGAKYCQKVGLDLVTFSGFAADNPLRQLGKINFWVDSNSYNIIENTHQIWLLALCDLLVHNIELENRQFLKNETTHNEKFIQF